MPREWRPRVEDILEAAERIIEYTRDMEFADFRNDRKTVDAVIRNFEIIGEASRHVPDDILASHPTIPWTEMRALRNVLAHAYFGVNLETIWKTTRESLPALVVPLRAILNREPSGRQG